MNGVCDKKEYVCQDRIEIRVGDTIIHCNDEFVIVDMRREETSEGMRLLVQAADGDTASRLQEERIKHEQMMDKGTNLLKDIADKMQKGLEDLGGMGRGGVV